MAESKSEAHVVDKGGYWQGTSRDQNDVTTIINSSTKRSEMLMQVLKNHGPELQEMKRKFPKTNVNDLVRFLVARKFNVEQASAMYQAHLDWRQATLPQLESEKSKILKTLATRKFYVLDDLDQGGRPVLVYCLHRFKDLGYNVDDEVKALIYMMEHQVWPKFGPNLDTQRFTVLIDVSGIRSPPISFLQTVNSIMEANYPETLFRSIMFPVPYWLQKVIQGFLVFVAQETKEKFAYVNDVKSLEGFAIMSVNEMGPDIVHLIKSKQLKK